MNLADLNAHLAAHVRRQNATPLAEFSGLSPDQMNPLLYEPLGPTGPVRLRAELPAAGLNGVPFLRLTEELMRVVQREGRIKLTASGALPRKFVHELYGHGIEPVRFIDEGTTSLNREADWSLLHTVREVATMGGLLKKVLGRLTLTKNGTALLAPARRPALLRAVLEAYTGKLNWGYHDNYGASTQPVGRFGWVFSLYLLARFGAETRPVDFYADKYLRAFPRLLEAIAEVPYMTPEAQLRGAYAYRTFARFGQWFGLTTFISGRWGPVETPDQVAATPLLTQLFWVVGQ